MNSGAQKPTDRLESLSDLTNTELSALQSRGAEAATARGVLGIDADGAIHLFGMATRRVAVFDGVDDIDPLVHDIRRLPVAEILPDADADRNDVLAWCVHVYRRRGAWRDLRACNSDARAALEAER